MTVSTYAEWRVPADGVLVALEDVPTKTLRIVAYGLRADGGRLRGFGDALDYLATARELHAEGVRGDPVLARLRLGVELRRLSVDADELLERLDGATEEPWRALREALLAGQGAASAS